MSWGEIAMSSKPTASGKPIPVAKLAPAGMRVKVDPNAEPETEAVLLTPAGIKGWVISGILHVLLIIVLALWVFSPPKNQPRQLDTRLAGSEFGVPEGINTLGGIDTPIFMAEPPKTISADAKTTNIPELKSDDLMITNPAAGFAGKTGGNPGAGLGDGFGLAKFGHGGENVNGVEVKVGDPQFTLLWDTKVDLDLHVIEPGGKEIYWLDTKGQYNGELDVDNREGLGPENIYWLKQNADGSKDLGLGPAGEYRWFVHYYRGFNDGQNIPTRWKVRIKHNGKVDVIQGKLLVKDSRSKEYVLKIDPGPGRSTVKAR
jgi:hypothetical protein